MARLTRGRLKKVVRAYRLVLQVEPTNHTARLKVARALRLLGKRDEAIQEYSTLAHHLAREGDLFGPISACKSILDLDPQHQETQLNLARLYALTPSPEAPGRVAMPLDSTPALPAMSQVQPALPAHEPNWADAPPTPQPQPPGPRAPLVSPLPPRDPDRVPTGGLGVQGMRLDGLAAVRAPTGWDDPVHPSTVELAFDDLEVVEELRGGVDRVDSEDFEALPTRVAGSPSPLLNAQSAAARAIDAVDEEDELPTSVMDSRDFPLPSDAGDTRANPSALAEAVVDEILSAAQDETFGGSEDPTVGAEMPGPDTAQSPSLAGVVARGLEEPSRAVGVGISLPAIELRDTDFEVIDQEPDSGDVIDTARLTEGWDRIADSLAQETDSHLIRASSRPDLPTVDPGARPSPADGPAVTAHPVTAPPVVAPAARQPTRRGTDGPVPDIPLFSSLSRDSFVRLVERMGRRRLAPGEVLVAGGHGADAIHVVARGGLKATRDGDDGRAVTLAQLGPGEFVGEFTFLTGVPSPATISADEESEVLRISNEVMRSVVADHPEVETVLWRFFVDRMTHSLLATSALFQGLTADKQLDVGRRFKPVEVRSGTTVIREGEPASGLYLVVSGGVDVLVGKGEHRRRVASLTPGEFFGVRTAATGTPPTSRVVSTEDSMLLVLPSADFREILEQEPSVQVAVDTVSGMRRLLTNALFHGQTSYASDGLLQF